MQPDADTLYAAIRATTADGRYADRRDVELAILCDLAELLRPHLDTEQSAALDAANQRIEGITEEVRVLHLAKLTRKMDQLFEEMRRTGKELNRAESRNRVVWAALRKLDGLDPSTAEFYAEVSLEAGLAPAAISGVYQRHMPNFCNPFHAG